MSKDKVLMKISISKHERDLIEKYAELRGTSAENMLIGRVVREMQREFLPYGDWEKKLLAGKLKVGSRGEIIDFE